jgi:CheY-like chemotaxis protein
MRPLRILFADDSPPIQKIVVGLLMSNGHAVVVVQNGLEALRALEQETFDLILMDIEMPEMDGLQATSAIRAREQGTPRRVPIVAVTAHATNEDRQLFLLAGMDAHVPKPIDPAQLHQVILETMSKATMKDDELNDSNRSSPLGH